MAEDLREQIASAIGDHIGAPDSPFDPHGWRCYDKELYPGPCRCTPALVDDLLAVVEPLLAQAWDEGHRHTQRRGPDNCQCAAHYAGECACGEYGCGPIISLADNPYRKESQ